MPERVYHFLSGHAERAAGRPRTVRTVGLLVYDGIASATKSNPTVGVRGDFSFVTFLCVVDKEK